MHVKFATGVRLPGLGGGGYAMELPDIDLRGYYVIEKWSHDLRGVISPILVLLVSTGGLSHADELGYIAFVSSENDQAESHGTVTIHHQSCS